MSGYFLYADPLPLAQELIRCQSVTPVDGGALDTLESALITLGFLVWRLPFSASGTLKIDNLYARRWGIKDCNFCFAGHTDVVPPGQGWMLDPFAGAITDGRLFGRGAVDMKGAVACFVAAVARILEQRGNLPGSVSLLITGDEEGPALDGTVRVLVWLQEHKERLDACLVGEPTNPGWLGEMIKIGRRGSLNVWLQVLGNQGHVAYPHLTDNPIDCLLEILAVLRQHPLDEGSAHFQPSTLVLTSLDVGNPTPNIIPAKAQAAFNIRFNDQHTGASIERWIRSCCAAVGSAYELSCVTNGEPFLTIPGLLTRVVSEAIHAITGSTPLLSTSGGTSDARFIKGICPVVEFGLVGQTMHRANESTSLTDLEALTEIYRRVLENYFVASV